jgi:hypothetical protein
MVRLYLYLTLTLVVLSHPAWAGEVPQDATEVHPLLIGATLPDAPLRTADDEETTLYAALDDSPAVLVYYRGGW